MMELDRVMRRAALREKARSIEAAHRFTDIGSFAQEVLEELSAAKPGEQYSRLPAIEQYGRSPAIEHDLPAQKAANLHMRNTLLDAAHDTSDREANAAALLNPGKLALGPYPYK